jgi:hypothetical protein
MALIVWLGLSLRSPLFGVFLALWSASVGAQPSSADAVAETQKVGKTFSIKATDLPKPKATPTVNNGPLTIPFAGQVPKVPPARRTARA